MHPAGCPFIPSSSRPRVPALVLAIALFCVVLLPWHAASAGQTERVVLVVIDGLRYTEGMGDPARTYVPEMDLLAGQGTLVENFRNDGYTYTSRAVPAIWCGGWTQMISFSDPACGGMTNYYSAMPSLFEYYRKGLGRPADDCIYVLKYLCSWKGSFHADYGPAYWPTYHAVGSTDTDVWNQAQAVLATEEPHFMLLYLADVDHAGHSGDWAAYTQAIETADDIVGRLWQTLQTDPVYAGKTTLIVTNDHGRHTTDFTGHGDSCEGCRRIQFLAVGPDIRVGAVTTLPRVIPDITPTIGALLGFETPLVTGSAMEEIFRAETGLEDGFAGISSPGLALSVLPSPVRSRAELRFTLSAPGRTECAVYDLAGRRVETLLDEDLEAGPHVLSWEPRGAASAFPGTGIYFVTLRTAQERAARRVLLLP